jgi:NADH-quinone oxidoreductase subunit I
MHRLQSLLDQLSGGMHSRGRGVSPGERYAEVYEINLLRCIYCGYCEEACPVDAVVLREHYELADYDRDKYIATKDDLLLYPVANEFRVNILGNTERVNSK